MTNKQEHPALDQNERLSFDTQVDSLQSDGNTGLTWPEIDVESRDDNDTAVRKPQATAQWDIKTGGELYLESLGKLVTICIALLTKCSCSIPVLSEKRLKQTASRTGREAASNTGSQVGDNVLHLPPASNASDSDDEEEPSNGKAEDPPVPASETTCLLYDARQQQKERNRFLRDEVDSDPTYNEHGVRTTENPMSSTSPPSGSLKSSTNSAPGPPSVQPILGQSNLQDTLSSRIQFSDSVRISGGIKSRRSSRKISASSIFVTPVRESEVLTRARTASTSIVEQSPSCSPSTSHFATPRGSFSRGSGRVSRAASFLSEDGNATGRSRASTPASIYAPLLLPSKTAPSPGRHFYLTFERSDGQATYRELVRRENERKKNKGHRRGRPKNKRLTKSWGRDDNDDDVENSEDSDSDNGVHFGSGWCLGLPFWTCGISRIFQRHSRWRRRHYMRSNTSDIESQTENPSVASISDDEESVSDGQQENKSEMQVIFGPKPWRYLKLGYWMYHIRQVRGSGAEVEDW